MTGLYEVEVEPEVSVWLDRLSARDFGRVDFLVGVLAERAETLGEPYTPAIWTAKSVSGASTCCASRPA